jgi:hypothetical protein
MDSIVRLLFGREAGELAELFMPDDQAGSDMADRARRAGEWCGSTPGRGSGRIRELRHQGIAPDSRLTAHVLGMS